MWKLWQGVLLRDCQCVESYVDSYGGVTSMDECKEVYEKLLRELSEDQFSISIERSVAQVQLKDGREARRTIGTIWSD